MYFPSMLVRKNYNYGNKPAIQGVIEQEQVDK